MIVDLQAVHTELTRIAEGIEEMPVRGEERRTTMREWATRLRSLRALVAQPPAKPSAEKA